MSHNGFTAVRGMKHTSQHCCDNAVDDKMALYRKFCFPNCKKIMVNKIAFVGFTEGDRPPDNTSFDDTRYFCDVRSISNLFECVFPVNGDSGTCEIFLVKTESLSLTRLRKTNLKRAARRTQSLWIFVYSRSTFLQ